MCQLIKRQTWVTILASASTAAVPATDGSTGGVGPGAAGRRRVGAYVAGVKDLVWVRRSGRVCGTDWVGWGSRVGRRSGIGWADWVCRRCGIRRWVGVGEGCRRGSCISWRSSSVSGGVAVVDLGGDEVDTRVRPDLGRNSRSSGRRPVSTAWGGRRALESAGPLALNKLHQLTDLAIDAGVQLDTGENLRADGLGDDEVILGVDMAQDVAGEDEALAAETATRTVVVIALVARAALFGVDFVVVEGRLLEPVGVTHLAGDGRAVLWEPDERAGSVRLGRRDRR